MNASHVQTLSLFITLSLSVRNHIANFLESFRSLLRMGESVWSSPPEPEQVFRQSFSASGVISAMKVITKRCFLSATTAASFSSFTYVIIAQIGVLAKALSWLSFLTIS
jgi:hypothetical protein